MRIFAIALITLILVAAGLAADDQSPVTPYLGLAMPVPDTLPRLEVPIPDKLTIRNRSLMAVLEVDNKGKVGDIDFPSDSADYIAAVRDDLKKVRFDFLEGREFDFPVKVPVHIDYSGPGTDKKTVTLRLPILPDTLSDTVLLNRFFELNGVVPPGIVDIPPLFYKVYPHRERRDLLMITARVFLDKNGDLTDIQYPIEGQRDMRHQVHMGIMNGAFTPAKFKGIAFASDFLLTFRIFDNLDYPFSPTRMEDTVEVPFTAVHMMAQYFNADDGDLPPLPRNHARGYIRAANLGRMRAGSALIALRIDDTGRSRGVSVLRSNPGLQQAARDAAVLIDWYPARTRYGEAVPFKGRITFDFIGSTRIVYIPEWLDN